MEALSKVLVRRGLHCGSQSVRLEHQWETPVHQVHPEGCLHRIQHCRVIEQVIQSCRIHGRSLLRGLDGIVLRHHGTDVQRDSAVPRSQARGAVSHQLYRQGHPFRACIESLNPEDLQILDAARRDPMERLHRRRRLTTELHT